MRDLFARAAVWSRERTPFAIATLVSVRNAAPAPPGASLAVTSGGTIAGDIGAGCHEGEIVEAAMLTANDGTARMLTIDLSGEDVIGGGSGCGGFLEVVTWRPPADFEDVADGIAAGDRDVTFPIAYERDGCIQEFVMTVSARRKLFIVGGTTLAQELASIAGQVDFRAVVIDPRPAFATSARLPAAGEILVAWPEDTLPALLTQVTPLVIISHDPKIDLPALRAGLMSEAPYIGLLGSRRAQDRRRAALQASGFDAAALARIRGPAGLDLGGVTPAEIAVSIMAEIIASARERQGGSLSQSRGAIHNARI